MPATIIAAKRHLIGDFGRYVPRIQRNILLDLLRGEEREGFAQIINELAERIATMPKTHEQDGEVAIVYLHYFAGGRANWWITEKDKDGGTPQAFGKADLLGDGGELGYICIDELAEHPAVELDLHWTPKPIMECQ